MIDQQGSVKASVNISPFSYQEVQMQIKTMLSEPIEFDDDDNLIELGLDSLKIMRIVNEWRRAGSLVTFADLIEALRLSDWWSMLQKNNTGLPVVNEVATEVEAHGDENQPFSLTDVQHAYWIGRRDDQPLGGVGCHAYLEIDGKGVEPQRLELAWTQLLTHHSMLRARFLANGRQEVVDTPLRKALLVHDLRLYSESELTLELKRIRNRLSHRRLPVEKGEVVSLEQVWFIESDQTLELLDKFRDVFGNDDFVVLLVESDNFFEPENTRALGRLAKVLETEVAYLKDITWLGNVESMLRAPGTALTFMSF